MEGWEAFLVRKGGFLAGWEVLDELLGFLWCSVGR